jgi:hypothetical protein
MSKQGPEAMDKDANALMGQRGAVLPDGTRIGLKRVVTRAWAEQYGIYGGHCPMED